MTIKITIIRKDAESIIALNLLLYYKKNLKIERGFNMESVLRQGTFSAGMRRNFQAQLDFYRTKSQNIYPFNRILPSYEQS
ncbi:hypothetical protein [Methanosarcina barkeri]|uniref:hypothetical protein n=1 Tax=Methanosarcina barkeri TaxID=2208 RepID=UPI0006D0E701|nr:hypothetical protein [Methanosarcina barkeri]